MPCVLKSPVALILSMGTPRRWDLRATSSLVDMTWMGQIATLRFNLRANEVHGKPHTALRIRATGAMHKHTFGITRPPSASRAELWHLPGGASERVHASDPGPETGRLTCIAEQAGAAAVATRTAAPLLRSHPVLSTYSVAPSCSYLSLAPDVCRLQQTWLL